MASRCRQPVSASKSAAQLATIAVASPFVIASRMTGMWLDALSPTSGGEREKTRMVVEKIAASAESMAAANAEFAKEAMKAGRAFATGAPGWKTLDVDAVVNASLKPYSKRVTSNARRLGGKR